MISGVTTGIWLQGDDAEVELGLTLAMWTVQKGGRGAVRSRGRVALRTLLNPTPSKAREFLTHAVQTADEGL